MGSWMSGIGSVLLQATVIYLLYKTYCTQREELRTSAQILHDQSESIRGQRVDASFFELLSRYDSAVESVFWNHPSGALKRFSGRPAFEYIVGDVRDAINKIDPKFEDWMKIRKVVESYNRQYSDWTRSINTICSFLKREGMQDIEYYMTIFSGYLSRYELELLHLELASRDVGSFTASFLVRNDVFRHYTRADATDVSVWEKVDERLKVHLVNYKQ